MTYYRPKSFEIPPGDDGMLGRECPRCFSQFTIDIQQYNERGYMNLRCPYCKFIAELDQFTTGEQRKYISSMGQNIAMEMVEQIFDEAFDGISGSSRGNVELDVDIQSGDFGRVRVEIPQFSSETYQEDCDDCGFSYGVEVEHDGVCPVCR